MPAKVAPELPLLVTEVPRGAKWLCELKLEGYRMICFVNKGKAALITRRGHDWTHRFPTIAAAIEGLELDNAIFDGEIVALKGATAIASYSTRARVGASVATPIAWDELTTSLRPGRFNTRTIPERLRTMKREPWQGFFEIRQTITRHMLAQIDSF